MGPDGTKLLEKGRHVRPLFVGTKLSSQRAGALWLPGGEGDQYEIVRPPHWQGEQPGADGRAETPQRQQAGVGVMIVAVPALSETNQTSCGHLKRLT